MIDWNSRAILKIEDHYNELFNPKLNLEYFSKHYEEIYRVITPEGEILPDLLNDITYYTTNGINARYKILLPKLDKKTEKKLIVNRMRQKAKRRSALERSIYSYYRFLLCEIIDFTKKYPHWNKILTPEEDIV